MVNTITQESYRKLRIQCADAWVNIISPITCDYLAFRNPGAVDLLIRTGLAGEEWDTLPPGAQESTPGLRMGSSVRRFVKGVVIGQVRSVDGSPQTLVTTWVA